MTPRPAPMSSTLQPRMSLPSSRYATSPAPPGDKKPSPQINCNRVSIAAVILTNSGLADSIDPHQSLPHLNTATFPHPLAQRYPRRRKHDDGGTMLEPAHFLPPAQTHLAGDDIGPAVAQVQQHVEKFQAHAGDQDRRHGDERHPCTR